MLTSENQSITLKRAYEILGVADSASTISIKLAYRRLAKRWHPDLYPKGSATRDEAAYMMRVVNEAYNAISHAPLRYSSAREGHAPAKPERGESAGESVVESGPLPVTSRVDFWARFLTGTAFSGVIGVSVVMEFNELRSSGYGALFLVGVAVLISASAFTAARYGDSLWAKALDRWWF